MGWKASLTLPVKGTAMKRWIGMAVLLLVLAGCDGDGAGGPTSTSPEPLEEPAFDLTGRWRYEGVVCSSVSEDLPEGTLAELDGQLAYEASQHPGVRIVQMGNDLEITYLDDGEQIDGTISGDQVQYFVSEYEEVDEWALEWYSEIEGTVLDANTIAVTEKADLTFRVDGMSGTADTECTGEAHRVTDEE